MDEDRLPATYLFYGASGIGKKRVAESLAQYLFCESLPTLLQQEATRPCLECASCKKISNHQHPDYFYLSPDGQKIKIEQIRQVQNKLVLTPLEALYKIVVIDDADLLTAQAANSLLKSLEEPPAHTLFILLASNLSGILPTIRSRCRRLYFAAPAGEDLISLMKEQLEGLDDEQASNLLALAEGSVGMAARFAASGLDQALADFTKILNTPHKNFTALSQLVARWVGDEVDLPLFMELLKKNYYNKAKTDNNWYLTDKIDLLTEAQFALEKNGNSQLVMENLLLNLF